MSSILSWENAKRAAIESKLRRKEVLLVSFTLLYTFYLFIVDFLI
jgi:hypothetical protein